MKFLYFILFSSFMLMACNKKNNNNPSPVDNKKYAIQFDASQFSSEISDMGRKRTSSVNLKDSLKNYVRDLHYLVYDFLGNEVKYQHQTANGTPNFGHISDSLSPGLYTVVFAAGSPHITLVGSYFDHSPLPLRSAGINYGGFDQDVVNVEESFFKKISLTVNGDSLISNVQLERVVGKIELVITDANSANFIRVMRSVESGKFQFDSAICSYPRPWSSVDGPGGQFSRVNDSTFQCYVSNNRVPFNITIQCLVGSDVVAERKLTNIIVSHNKKLKLSGKLFTGTAGSRFPINVDVNEQWADSTVLNF